MIVGILILRILKPSPDGDLKTLRLVWSGEWTDEPCQVWYLKYLSSSRTNFSSSHPQPHNNCITIIIKPSIIINNHGRQNNSSQSCQMAELFNSAHNGRICTHPHLLSAPQGYSFFWPGALFSQIFDICFRISTPAFGRFGEPTQFFFLQKNHKWHPNKSSVSPTHWNPGWQPERKGVLPRS